MDFVDEYYADKDLSPLKKLTLVIPTYNRNYYLSRCLWYHAHFPFGQIIVADSSPEEKKVVNRETVAKIREMFGANILYLEYEPETEKYGEDIYQKWADAVKHSKKEYTKICTDKEFVIPDVVCECINYLDEHLDYGTADAVSLECCYCSTNINKTIWNIWTPGDLEYSNNNTIERCKDALNAQKQRMSAWNLLTAIRRTDNYNYIYSKLQEYSLLDIRFGDVFLQFISIICSKRKRISTKYYLIRDLSGLYDANGNMIPAESSSSRYPSLDTYIINGVIDDKIKNLRALVYELLSLNNNSGSNHSKHTDEITTTYLKTIGIRFPNNPTINKLYAILRYVYNRYPLLHNIINGRAVYRFDSRQIIEIDLSIHKELDVINKIIVNSISNQKLDIPIV